jgi:hypothetical protein
MARDLRQYASQTNRRLIAGGILLLFIVGDGLIYVFFGANAALMGLVCLVIGLIPLILVWGLLWLLDLALKHANQE